MAVLSVSIYSSDNGHHSIWLCHAFVAFIGIKTVLHYMISCRISTRMKWSLDYLKATVNAITNIISHWPSVIQYIPRNMHTVFALLCFVVVIHWLISPYPSGLLHWHCGNLTIAPVPAKQPWWIWMNTSCEFIMNDCITTTKQSTTKPCAYFLGYTVFQRGHGENYSWCYGYDATLLKPPMMLYSACPRCSPYIRVGLLVVASNGCCVNYFVVYKTNIVDVSHFR